MEVRWNIRYDIYGQSAKQEHTIFPPATAASRVAIFNKGPIQYPNTPARKGVTIYSHRSRILVISMRSTLGPFQLPTRLRADLTVRPVLGDKLPQNK